MTYQPKKEILEKYADVLINFALNSGDGIDEGEVVYLQFDHIAKPLAIETYKKILKAGGHPILRMYDEEFSPVFYENANDKQLEFFPEDYSKSLVDTIDQRVYIMAEENPFILKDIDPAKIMKSKKSKIKMRKWLEKKEDRGDLTWTLALYGTEGLAKEAGLSLEEFWNQIIRACFLDKENPLQEWQDAFDMIEETQDKLNALDIDKLHVEAEETDLWIKLGEKRKWLGGSGRNIPSFEIFTSPDWRGTNGKIYFNQPLYRYGNLIKDIRLEFKDGIVTKATASQNEELLKEMIKQENANKVGEYSLTDRRLSRINKFMANTLYDENFGGEYGNTHLAVGMSYHDAFSGDKSKMEEEDWQELGYNFSSVHTDIIATTDRKVTAILRDGSEKVIYEGGEFQL
jgi:aminopeptidase